MRESKWEGTPSDRPVREGLAGKVTCELRSKAWEPAMCSLRAEAFPVGEGSIHAVESSSWLQLLRRGQGCRLRWEGQPVTPRAVGSYWRVYSQGRAGSRVRALKRIWLLSGEHHREEEEGVGSLLKWCGLHEHGNLVNRDRKFISMKSRKTTERILAQQKFLLVCFKPIRLQHRVDLIYT